MKFIKYILFFLIIKVNALIFYTSLDPNYNTAPPVQYVDLWNLQGDFGNFIGTPISPYHFITVQHVETQNIITINRDEYQTLSYYDDWASNLRIYKIKGKFIKYTTLYEKNDEIGKSIVVFGRGVGKGEEVRLSNELRGWKWDNVGGIMRWGENTVDDVVISYAGDVLKTMFNPQKNLLNLCSLTVGDSGGGMFIKDGNEWKLAGVNYGVDSGYGFNNMGDRDGEYFRASIFNEKDLFKFDGSEWFRIGESSATGSYAIRVSSRMYWIKRIVEWTYPVINITLQSADNPYGPYNNEISIINDIDNKQITVPIPTQTTYYRLSAQDKLKIIGIIMKDDKLVIVYGRL